MWIRPIFLFLLCALSSCTQEGKGVRQFEEFKAHVVEVKDGDTIVVQTSEQRRITIRLYGIDAPEYDQPYGPEAKIFLNHMILDQDVTVLPCDKDVYGRCVAVVKLRDQDVNKTMLGEGLAWWYRYYALNKKQYRQLEGRARMEHKGLWKDPDPEAPWKFRKDKKKRDY